jgi:Site-specific recombinase XerD
MPPKKRKEGLHLPPRVYYKHNAYYFVDVKRKWHRLGSNLADAMNKWAKIIDQSGKIVTMNQLFNRYMLEVAPLKSPGSYNKNIYQIQNLRESFGDMYPEDITPVDIYRYIDLRGKVAPVSANREKSLLSHVFSMAIRWGVMRDNPCRNVKRLTEKPRKRYIEDWEYLEVRKVAPLQIQLLMDFAYLTGQRIGDILTIKLSDLTEDGIKIEQNKTGTRIIIAWSDELRDCVQKIRKLPRSIIHSFTLFCNSKGQPLVYDAFSNGWLKTMKTALANGVLKERFTFHDIRAKAASDSKNKANASALLGHADPKITERVYNRKANKVQPLR